MYNQQRRYFLPPLFPSLLLRWLISVLSSPVSWPLQPEWMPLSARPSNPQTAAPLLPLSCHALLMSLSLTQLLLRRLDVINLLKVECQPAITCLHLCYSTLAVYSDSPLSHLWYTFSPSFPALAATLALSLHLSPSLQPVSLSLSSAAALPRHVFFMRPSHVRLELQERRTGPKQAQKPQKNMRWWRGSEDKFAKIGIMGVNAKTAARATEDEHGPEKHKLGTPGLTLRLWSLTARARAMRTEIMQYRTS